MYKTTEQYIKEAVNCITEENYGNFSSTKNQSGISVSKNPDKSQHSISDCLAIHWPGNAAKHNKNSK